jgi:transcriptional regulator with XRE-family HTH domain
VNRPWASGLARLLADTRLKKSDLAELSGIRAGTISAVANSPKAPDIATLQRLADGFTKARRRGHPHAPAVELWHFFVSDEQAQLLQQSATQQRQLVKQDELLDRVMSRLAPLVTGVLHEELHGVPVEPAARKKA